MIVRKSRFTLGAVLLWTLSLTSAISPREIPEDTPISSLVTSAKRELAAGNSNDALTYFDLAISRDPKNYLTLFQRGVAYLSLGRSTKAGDDFDKVLSIKPDFEGALLQQAKLKSKNADWAGARANYKKAKKLDSREYQNLEEAEGAAVLAVQAEKSGDYEACVTHSGAAILVAGTALELRQLRSRCRFERGEILEGVADLQHVLQLAPRNTEPHTQISAMLFYSIGDLETGLSQLSKCLQYDPDAKACNRLRKQEKKLEKLYNNMLQLQERKQYNSAVKLLVGQKGEAGLIDTVKDDVAAARVAGIIHKNAPKGLYSDLVERTCDLYVQVCVLLSHG